MNKSSLKLQLTSKCENQIVEIILVFSMYVICRYLKCWNFATKKIQRKKICEWKNIHILEYNIGMLLFQQHGIFKVN
jgi:hypothetical protein